MLERHGRDRVIGSNRPLLGRSPRIGWQVLTGGYNTTKVPQTVILSNGLIRLMFTNDLDKMNESAN